jgi:hypothetical protein
MTTMLATGENSNQRLARLKNQQQLCNKLLMDCVSLMEVYPDHTERLMSVMGRIEDMMAQNNRLLARMGVERLT